MIQIQEEVATGGRLYSIAGGSSCSIASYQWILTPFGTSQKIIVGSNNTYFKSDPQTTGDEITVTVTNFTETYWTGGEFYGGDFRGNFGGGTFHYGQLNDCFYLKQEIKPKPFIEDINKPTGPQSVKPIDTSRLL